jgi:Ser/Thr protein kinase RdoA (MazF antagonist)
VSGQVTDLTRQRLIRHGLAAAAALVKRLGLPAGEHSVLSNRGNLIVYFPAGSLVARVATLTAWTRREPYTWLAREVAVARYVAGRGGPVVPPARGVDPGPHWQDGFAISLWEHAGPPAGQGPGTEPSPAECGALLARFHEAARDCPAALGDLSPATEQVTDALAVIERENLAGPAAVSALRAEHARVLDGIGHASAEAPRLVLHGDAHERNMLRVARGRSGWVWTDLEETTRGPASWDLATLTSSYDKPAAREALRAYASESGNVVPAPEALSPFHRARDLEAAVWLLCMAHLYPERYAAPAQASLASVLDAPPPGSGS